MPRKPVYNDRRSSVEFSPPQQQSQQKSVPAPVGGWNARDPLASMGPLDAVLMDNFYPSTGDVSLRGGKSSWATGVTDAIKTLITYNGGSSQKLFASTVSGIYDVTAGGAIGAAAVACTNGKWEYVNFANSGGNWLAMVNGVDAYKNYDGTTWTTPATAGVVNTTLTNIQIHKRKVWFTQAGTLDAWYLATDAIAGAATKFPMGPVFSAGGQLVAQASWTVDGGQGSDDYLVSVTSEGQISIYQGIDPAADFILVGVYDIGKPIGKRCFLKYGGDLIYLSKRGVFPLSKLLLSATLDRQIALSGKIDGAWKAAVESQADVFGWQAIFHPTKNCLMINIPVAEGVYSNQFVMNDITKAWCRFNGWNFDCMGQLGDNIYGALGSVVYKTWSGFSDAGIAISGNCWSAYLTLGSQLQITLVRPQISVQGSITLQTSIDTDFALFSGVNDINSLSYNNIGSLWGIGHWDSSLWSTGLIPIGGKWLTCANRPGTFHSFRLQCATSTSTVAWTSTDYALLIAGIL